MASYSELIRALRQLDEITLLELLDVSSEDLVEAFKSKLEERRGYIEKELEIEDQD